jgi:hypothetical protein
MFPIEVGTWGADAVKFRQEYGKDLLLMGGFDKKILARSKDEIEAEVEQEEEASAEQGLGARVRSWFRRVLSTFGLDD